MPDRGVRGGIHPRGPPVGWGGTQGASARQPPGRRSHSGHSSPRVAQSTAGAQQPRRRVVVSHFCRLEQPPPLRRGQRLAGAMEALAVRTTRVHALSLERYDTVPPGAFVWLKGVLERHLLDESVPVAATDLLESERGQVLLAEKHSCIWGRCMPRGLSWALQADISSLRVLVQRAGASASGRAGQTSSRDGRL